MRRSAVAPPLFPICSAAALKTFCQSSVASFALQRSAVAPALSHLIVVFRSAAAIQRSASALQRSAVLHTLIFVCHLCGGDTTLPVQLSQLIVVFRSAAALERSATPRHRLRCSVLPAFLHPPYAGALCELSPSICLFGDNSHSPYCGAKRSASILHVCKSTKNKPFLIVVCDSVSAAKFFTLQPCVNVLRQIRDSITLVSSPIFLFCAADSRTHRPPPPLNCHASCRRRAATIAAATAALLPSLLCFHCRRAATAATAATAAAVAFVFVVVVVSAC